MIRTLPDMTLHKGVVASAAAFRQGSRTLDHMAETLETRGDREWLRPEPLMWVRQDGLVLDAKHSPWHDHRVQLRHSGAGSVSAPIPAVSPHDDPAPLAAHLLRVVGAALGSARKGVPTPWNAPPRMTIELHEAYEASEHSSVKFTHASPVSLPGVHVTGVRAKGPDAGVIRRLCDAVPPRPCRVITRSRSGRNRGGPDAMSSIELIAPQTWFPFRELDAITMMRLHAAAAARRR